MADAAKFSASDLQLARDVGVPHVVGEELWIRGAEGTVALTLKGAAFLTEVSRIHRVPLDLSEVSTYKQLAWFRFQVSCAVEEAARADVRSALKAGKIPAKDRAFMAAFVQADEGTMLEASQQHNALDGHENVVMLPRK